ncbi:MAG: hypothetical protein ACYS15_04250 [Planctomycetota bacterium]|jgi:hypothetical protein
MSEGGGAAGYEWVLLAVGLVLTLVVVGAFVFVLTRKDEGS